MKKRLFAAMTAAALTLSLAACGSSSQSRNTGSSVPASSAVASSAAESVAPSESVPTSAETTETNGKVLIVYFAVAENSDVDALSSASVVNVNGEGKGLTRTVAEDIQAVTGGDLFSIQTSVQYPGNIDDLINYASNEQSDNARPELTSQIENLDEYDTIFIGYPIWWYEMPQVMYSFFDEYDFSGKTIIPFSVHRGSRLSGTPSEIQKLEPNATVISDGFTVSHETAESSVSAVADDVAEWLHGLGY